MKSLRRAFGFLFLAMIGVGLAGAACAAVTLKSTAEVSRSAVRLSDVFEGLPAGLDRDIARAPAPGKSITYDVRTLAYLAKQYKLGWQPASYDDHTIITAACNKITTDDLRAAVLEKLKEADVKGDLGILFDNRIIDIDLPADRPAQFTLDNFEYDMTGKHFRAMLTANGASGPFTLPVIGHVTIRHSVPVLAHRLEAGTVIGEADLDWINLPEERLAGVITDTHQLVGQQLRRDADEGQPLHGHDVMPPQLVTRGALVTMKIETPFMLVTAQGRAMQDGTMGETVRVTNTQSNRVIQGTVGGAGLVIIHMPQQFAAVE